MKSKYSVTLEFETEDQMEDFLYSIVGEGKNILIKIEESLSERTKRTKEERSSNNDE